MKQQSLFCFPLRTNVEFFDTPERYLVLEKRIKQVMLLYDHIVFEDGTYICFTGSEGSWDSHIPPGHLSPEKRLSHGLSSSTSNGFSVVVEGHTVVKSSLERQFKSDFYSILKDIPFKSLDWCHYETFDLTSQGKKILNKENLGDQHDDEFFILGASRFLTRRIINNLNHDLLASACLGASISISPIYAPLIQRKIRRGQNIQPKFNFPIVDIALPDFTSMDWEQIFKVREDPAWKVLREKLWELNQKVYNAEFDSQADLRVYVSNLLTQEVLQEVRKFVPSRKKIVLDSFLGSIPSIAGVPIGQLITTSGSVRELVEYKHSWLALFMKLREIET